MPYPATLRKRLFGFIPKGVPKVDVADPINNNLVSAILFGDALNYDVSGRGHNGDLSAIKFSGSEFGLAYPTVGFSNGGFNISNLSLNTNNFSFVLFAKTADTSGGQNGYLDWISFLDTNGNIGILEKNGNPPHGPFFFNFSGATYSFGNVLGTTTVDGRWHQLACTFNNGVAQLYEDGLPIDTGTGVWNSTITVAQIGNRITQGSRTPDALFSSVRLYNRVLRPDEMLRLNYDPSAGLIYPQDILFNGGYAAANSGKQQFYYSRRGQPGKPQRGMV